MVLNPLVSTSFTSGSAIDEQLQSLSSQDLLAGQQQTNNSKASARAEQLESVLEAAYGMLEAQTGDEENPLVEKEVLLRKLREHKIERVWQLQRMRSEHWDKLESCPLQVHIHIGIQIRSYR